MSTDPMEADAFKALQREEQIKFMAWLALGQTNGWVDEVWCSMHDVPELTQAEILAWEDGLPPCVPVVRLMPFARYQYKGKNEAEPSTD